MTTMQNEPGNDTHGDDALARVFADARPRQRAPAAHRQAVFDAVQAEWGRVAARRLRRRRAALVGLAASVLVVALALIRMPAVTSSPPVVASADRIEGAVLFRRAGEGTWDSLAATGHVVRAGDELRTGEGALALRLAGGGSLRLGRQTSVTLTAPAVVDMPSGMLYFDSGYALSGAGIAVTTPFGTVRDVGTQFALRTDARALRLAVRSGRAELSRAGQASLTADAGERLEADGAGVHGPAQTPTSGAQWAWAERLAPVFDLEGRRVRELLAWYAYETGLTVEYAGDAADRADAALSGQMIDGAQQGALNHTLATAGLVSRQPAGGNTLVISTLE